MAQLWNLFILLKTHLWEHSDLLQYVRRELTSLLYLTH